MKSRNLLKRLTVFVLSFSVVFSVVACKVDNNESGGNSGQQTTQIKDTNYVLCENGNSEYKILLAEDASACEQYAASELQRYLYRATNATLNIIYESEILEVPNKYISVGRTEKLEDSGINVTETEVSRDGYKIIRKEQDVYICGGYDTGTAFGVYEFLKHQIGYEAYAADEIYCDTVDKVYVKDFNMTDIPDFKARTMDSIMQADGDTAFKYRLVTEQESAAKYGYGAANAWIPGPYHTIKLVVPEDVYNNANKPETYHPEWFLANQYHQPVYAQCCYTNEAFIQTFIDNMIDLIIANPLGRIVNIAQQDGYTWCPCETCEEEYVLYRHSGYFVRFANKVVKAIEQWRLDNCPERELEYAMFAYSNTSAPPLDDSGNLLDESCRPHKKLNIRMAFSGGCYYHTLDDKNCAMNSNLLENVIKKWATICNNYYVWAYAAYYSEYMIFFNDFEAVQRTLQIYKEYGFGKQIFYQQASGNTWQPFGYLRAYIKAKLMWNTDLDVEAMMDDFFTHYYKETAKEMRQLLDFYRTYDKTNDEMANYTWHSNPGSTESINGVARWPKNVVEQAEAYINNALEKCKTISDQNERDKVEKRIRNERISIWYLKLINYSFYGYDSSQYEMFVKQFADEVRALGISRVSETQTMDKFLAGLGQ